MNPSRHLVAVDSGVAPSINVVIADDHPLMRRSLRGVLEATAGVAVVAEAGDLALTGQHVTGHRPEVLVLDLNMRDGSSLQLIEELRERAPDTRVVVMSVDDTPGFAQRALSAGACGYVLKEHADAELPDAVNAVAGGAQYVSPPIAARLAEMRRALTGGLLSTRETEVLRLIALGYTNNEIAAQLGVSPRTVETHRAHILRKLDMRTRAELVGYALRHGLLAA